MTVFRNQSNRNTSLNSTIWILALFALLVNAHVTTAVEIAKGATVEGITQYELDNGLQILLYPDESRPTVTVNLTVFVGSRHEGYGETGMAHLLEHMVFKGSTSHHAGEFDRKARRLTGQLGLTERITTRHCQRVMKTSKLQST